MKTKTNFLIHSLIIGLLTTTALLMISISCSSEDNKEIEKEVSKSIPELTTSSATNITHEMANSGGNITKDGGAAVTARGVCWSTKQSPTINDNKTIDGKGKGEFSSSLNSLASETKYYVRAYATNSVGTAY